MSVLTDTSDTQFYTTDHEWIVQRDNSVHVGICDFKLIGIDTIDRIEFSNLTNPVKKGTVLATVVSEEYRIPVHMPMDGWVIENNSELINGPQVVLNGPVWISKVVPVSSHFITDLLTAEQYFNKQKARVGGK